MPKFQFYFFYFFLFFFNLIKCNEILIDFNSNDGFEQINQLIKEPFILEEISYKSDVPFQIDEFDYLVGLKKRQINCLSDVRNALCYLKLKNKFECVKLRINNGCQGKKLHFEFTGFWKIQKIKINGISFSKNSYLQKYILEPGDNFHQHKHLHSIEKIKKLLHCNGYLNAEVIDKLVKDISNKSIIVDLTIKKGKRFHINNVEFLMYSDQSNLVDEISQKRMKFEINKIFLYKFLKHKFIDKDLSKNLKKLKAFLLNQNYPFSRVKLNKTINYIDSTVQIKIEINLDQKLRLEFNGNKYFYNDQLSTFILELGYPLFDLSEDVLEYEIKKFYKNYGFDDVIIKVIKQDFIFKILITEGKKNSSDIGLNIYEIEQESATTKPLIDEKIKRFGKIVQLGNSNIPFKKIIKEIDIKEGDIWSREKLQKAFLKLNDLEIFESINFNILSPEYLCSNKPVILKLFSDDDNEFKIRAGILQFSYDFNILKLWSYKLGATLSTKNKFLYGDRIIFDCDFTRFYQKSVLSYKTPWIFDYPVNCLFQLYYNHYYQPLFYKIYKDNLFKINEQGISANFLSRHTHNYNLGINIGFERLKISQLTQDSAKAIRFSNRLVDKFIPYFFIEPTLILEHLDDRLNTRSGYSIALNLKGMQSFKYDNSFLKFLLEQSIYIPVLKNDALAIRFRFGHIFIKDFDSLLPSERFYLGGPTSMRSYEPDFSPPYGFLVRCKSKNNNCLKCKKLNVPQGGSTMINLNLELRMPLQIVKNLSFVIFNDLGSLYNIYSECDKKLLTATGFGVRYKTPIGPFRFDIGFRGKDFKNDSFFAWYLTLGQAF